GAAHAGCFSMALGVVLGQAGHEPESISTDAKVRFGKEGDGFAIQSIQLTTRARVPGIDADAFRRAAEAAKDNCPVSKALGGTVASASDWWAAFPVGMPASSRIEEPSAVMNALRCSRRAVSTGHDGRARPRRLRRGRAPCGRPTPGPGAPARGSRAGVGAAR